MSLLTEYSDEIYDLKRQLALAESKLSEFEQEWDGEKYVFTPTPSRTSWGLMAAGEKKR